MTTKILAAIGLAICLWMALRMVLPARINARIDTLTWRVLGALRGLANRARTWRRDKKIEKDAAVEAEEAIRRARKASRMVEGEWDGNVYRPRQFGQKGDRRDKRNLH